MLQIRIFYPVRELKPRPNSRCDPSSIKITKGLLEREKERVADTQNIQF